MMRRNPFIFSMVLGAAAIVLAAVVPLASGTTSSTSPEVCTDELAACIADTDCQECAVAFDTDSCVFEIATTSDFDDACEILHDWVCCVMDDADCQDNELMIEYFDCRSSDISCTEDFDCTDSSDTSANGATGIVNSAVVSGCLAITPVVGIMTTVFATG